MTTASLLKARTAIRTPVVATVLITRILVAIIALITLSQLTSLGVGIGWLVGAAIIGVYQGSVQSFSSCTHRQFFIKLIQAVVILFLIDQGGQLIESHFHSVFGWYVFTLQLWVLLTVMLLSSASVWLSLRTSWWVTVELGLLGTTALYLFSPHRDFRFDALKFVTAIAWDWNINELLLFSMFGAVLAFTAAGYAVALTHPALASQVPVVAERTTFVRGKRSWQSVVGALSVVTVLIALIGGVVYRSVTIAAGTRLMNGVGTADKEGVSPLGFHSALGATNQPAALVRLDGDYAANPFSPMLYLREDALSEFNGHEMVKADREFDHDVTNSSPFDEFQSKGDPSLLPRVSLSQSVYLLADHKIAFAVDFPLSIQPLKNPNAGRFKAAYRAYSMAPAFTIGELDNLEVGNPDWEPAVREHYLKTHSDARYTELAKKIAAGKTSPIAKATALTDYLSANAIYTLTPNHIVKPDEDQTAPFLFGDMRGYCVHFAHAMVYMLRALGIPARVGTGYLTDLSQAKDGHILLRMSDRHAWSEVYVRDKGWVPFDIKPEKVESHGDTQVDLKLLEELMSQLQPDEELLPKTPQTPEKGLENEHGLRDLIPSWSFLGILVTLIYLVPVLTLAVLKNIWRLPLGPAQKLRWAHRAQVLTLAGLGIVRPFGATVNEFAASLPKLPSSALSLSNAFNELRFAERVPSELSQLGAKIRESSNSLRPLPWWKRLLANLSPAALFRGWR